MMKSRVLLICIAVAFGLLAIAESKSDEQGKDGTPSMPDASDKFIGKDAGQVRDDNDLKMKLVWCPPGKFTMGSPKTELGFNNKRYDNEDQVSVTLTKGFWLAETELTQGQWQKLMGTNPWSGKVKVKDSAYSFKEGAD